MKKIEQEETEEIQEMSTMSSGATQVAAVKGEKEDKEDKEDKLRSMIREVLKAYAKKRNILSQQEIFELKLRESIRNILLEKQSKDSPPGSTLEGIMRSLLNNIVPQLRIQYMQMQSKDEERQGFKDYFYNAVENITDLTKDQRAAEEEEGSMELEELKLNFKPDDPDFISGVFDGSEEPEKKTKSTKGNSKKDISSYYERGQNFGEKAFIAVKDRIQDAVASQIVPDEYPEFEKLLSSNLQAWFKIWDQNKTNSLQVSSINSDPSMSSSSDQDSTGEMFSEPGDGESEKENLEEMEFEIF